MIEVANDILGVKYSMSEETMECINFSVYVPVSENEEWE